jgi:hypothetical protein
MYNFLFKGVKLMRLKVLVHLLYYKVSVKWLDSKQ